MHPIGTLPLTVFRHRDRLPGFAVSREEGCEWAECRCPPESGHEGLFMAKRCFVCGKGPMSGNLVSHSNRKTRTRRLPNLQPVRIVDGAASRRVRVCTRCLKAGKVKRAA